MPQVKIVGSPRSARVFHPENSRWFFLGTILANCAIWTQDVKLSWLVHDLAASGAMLGTMSLIGAIATLGLSPLAGIVIDRNFLLLPLLACLKPAS